MAMLTYTGRVVLPEIAAPSLLDIAVATSRMTRFGGHTKRWWSVLDHTLFCDVLAQRQFPNDPQLREARLAMLLHDAHEAVTADVPTDAKGPGLKILQSDLDRAIMGRYFPGGYPAYDSWKADVREIDLRALVAEAHVVGPPVSRARLEEVEPRFRAVMGLENGKPTRDALDHAILRGNVENGEWGRVPLAVKQENHPAVQEYLSRMNTLL